jgi:predicted amidophosphoribosyltransferase
MLVPVVCAGCGQVGEGVVCEVCIGSLEAAPVLAVPQGASWLITLFGYCGVGKNLVAAAKYRNGRPVQRWAGTELGKRCRLLRAEVAWVSWVPCRAERYRRFGYDPGQVLATAAARVLGVPARRTLRRQDHSPQAERLRAHRLEGPSLREVRRLPTGPGLVVDDVITTGASLSVAAQALSDGGERSIVVGAMAATPDTGANPPQLQSSERRRPVG